MPNLVRQVPWTNIKLRGAFPFDAADPGIHSVLSLGPTKPINGAPQALTPRTIDPSITGYNNRSLSHIVTERHPTASTDTTETNNSSTLPLIHGTYYIEEANPATPYQVTESGTTIGGNRYRSYARYPLQSINKNISFSKTKGAFYPYLTKVSSSGAGRYDIPLGPGTFAVKFSIIGAGGGGGGGDRQVSGNIERSGGSGQAGAHLEGVFYVSSTSDQHFLRIYVGQGGNGGIHGPARSSGVQYTQNGFGLEGFKGGKGGQARRGGASGWGGAGGAATVIDWWQNGAAGINLGAGLLTNNVIVVAGGGGGGGGAGQFGEYPGGQVIYQIQENYVDYSGNPVTDNFTRVSLQYGAAPYVADFFGVATKNYTYPFYYPANHPLANQKNPGMYYNNGYGSGGFSQSSYIPPLKHTGGANPEYAPNRNFYNDPATGAPRPADVAAGAIVNGYNGVGGFKMYTDYYKYYIDAGLFQNYPNNVGPIIISDTSYYMINFQGGGAASGSAASDIYDGGGGGGGGGPWGLPGTGTPDAVYVDDNNVQRVGLYPAYGQYFNAFDKNGGGGGGGLSWWCYKLTDNQVETGLRGYNYDFNMYGLNYVHSSNQFAYEGPLFPIYTYNIANGVWTTRREGGSWMAGYGGLGGYGDGSTSKGNDGNDGSFSLIITNAQWALYNNENGDRAARTWLESGSAWLGGLSPSPRNDYTGDANGYALAPDEYPPIPYSTNLGCPDPNELINIDVDKKVKAGDIKQGDLVWTMHEKTKEYGFFKVESTAIVNQFKMKFFFTNGKSVIVSNSHKFLMENGEFTLARDCKLGNKIKNILGHSEVSRIVRMGVGEVVKLEIEDARTYIVNDLISHNLKTATP